MTNIVKNHQPSFFAPNQKEVHFTGRKTVIASIAMIAGSILAYFKGNRYGLAGSVLIVGLGYLIGMRRNIAVLPSSIPENLSATPSPIPLPKTAPEQPPSDLFSASPLTTSSLPCAQASFPIPSSQTAPVLASPVSLAPAPCKEDSLQFEHLVDQCANEPPVGIFNVGNNCFLAALIQLILQDRILTVALLEEANSHGKTQQIGLFLIKYLEKQLENKLKQQQTKESTSLSGIENIRSALCECDDSNEGWLTGQHDFSEALLVILQDPSLSERLAKKSYFSDQTIRRTWSAGPKTLVLNAITCKNNVTGQETMASDEMKFIPSTNKMDNQYQSTQIERGNPGIVWIPMNLGIDQTTLAVTLAQTMSQEEIKGDLVAKYWVVDSKNQMTEENLKWIRTEKKWVSAPRHLRVVFKRFKIGKDKKGKNIEQRIGDSVAIDNPMTLSSAIFEDGMKRTYKLNALAIHHGGTSTGYGHYLSYVLRGETWHQANDDVCSRQQSLQEILKTESANIYMAIYRLID